MMRLHPSKDSSVGLMFARLLLLLLLLLVLLEFCWKIMEKRECVYMNVYIDVAWAGKLLMCTLCICWHNVYRRAAAAVDL